MDYDYFAEQLRQLQRPESVSTSQHTDIDSDMPPLEPISPPSTSRIDMDVDDNHEERGTTSGSRIGGSSEEVEMNVESADDSEDPPLPEIVPVSTPTPRPNRRARVEDDDDDERDRRHPSQRITNPSSRQETRTSTPLPPPRTQSFAFDFLNTSSTAAAPSASSSTQVPHNASNPSPSPFAHPRTTPSGPQEQPQPAPRQHAIPGFTISFDLDGIRIGPTFTAAPNADGQGAAPGAQPTPQAQGAPQTFADLFSNPGFLHDVLGIEPDVDDPERADRLIKGLDEVPLGLVKRLERVGGIGSTGTDLSGGDSGCAVCWEKLLPDENADEGDSSKAKQKAVSETEAKPLPAIVALPCAHVFHADCLRPWFSRPKQTTCPTCRFNIDPENLTFIPYRQRHPAPPAPAPVPTTAPTPTRSEAPAEDPGPSTSSFRSSTDEGSRGRSSPDAAPPPRRAGSEPPLNRVPRPPTETGVRTGSFAIPGGHVVFVSQPIAINAQGQPVVGGQAHQAQQPTQSTSTDPEHNAGVPPAPAPGQASPTPPSAIPNTSERPTFGPPPPPNAAPSTTFPTNLPDGVIAFDIAVPIPASLLGAAFGAGSGAQRQNPSAPQANPPPTVPPQSQNTTPRPNAHPLWPPTGAFAGLNFGRAAGAPGAPSMSDLFRSLFQAPIGTPPTTGPQAPGAPPTPQPPAPGAPPTANSSPSTTPASADAQAPPQPQQPGSGQAGENRTPPPVNGHEALLRMMMTAAIMNPSFLVNLLFPNGQAGTAGADFGAGLFTQRDTGPKKEWTLPPPPGNTLRQRIEKREHEAGLRCSDISCGIGPSDDEPYISEADAQLKQLSIREAGSDGKNVCSHSFHSSCLVSAERVALRGADASIVGGNVAVSCPVCRGAGSISKSDWDEGVHTLQ